MKVYTLNQVHTTHFRDKNKRILKVQTCLTLSIYITQDLISKESHRQHRECVKGAHTATHPTTHQF